MEDITEAFWGTRVSPSAVSELRQQLYERIEAWRNQPIDGNFAYVSMDGICLKRSWGGEVKNVAVLVAIGVDRDGYRQVLGVSEGTKEDKVSWRAFLRHLKDRGLRGVQLVTSDKCLGLVEVLAEFYPETHASRGRVPRRQQRVDAGGRQVASHRGHQVGHTQVPGHDTTQGARASHPAGHVNRQPPSHPGAA